MTTSAFPKLDAYLAWFKAHERLVLFIVAVGAFGHYYSRVMDAWDRHDVVVAQAAATTVKTDDSETKALKQQLADLQKQVLDQAAIIASQIKQRQIETQQQQKTDAMLPPNELAMRWRSLVKLPDNNIDPATGEKFEVTNVAAVATVQMLELVPELESDATAYQTELQNDQMIIGKQTEMIAQLNKDIADEKKSHAADVVAAKAAGRRSWWRGFKIGAIVGFLGGAYIGHRI